MIVVLYFNDDLSFFSSATFSLLFFVSSFPKRRLETKRPLALLALAFLFMQVVTVTLLIFVEAFKGYLANKEEREQKPRRPSHGKEKVVKIVSHVWQ